MSLNPPLNEDDLEIMAKLRESLVEGYTSVLHGFAAPTSSQEPNQFAIQIYHYINALVS